MKHAPILLAALALAACNSAKQPPAKGGTAAGEILEGSVSDAMLPLDRVRSQPPLAPKGSFEGGEGKAAPKPHAKSSAEPTKAEAPADTPAPAAAEPEPAAKE